MNIVDSGKDNIKKKEKNPVTDIRANDKSTFIRKCMKESIRLLDYK
jgi:hypothetical protein